MEEIERSGGGRKKGEQRKIPASATTQNNSRTSLDDDEEEETHCALNFHTPPSIPVLYLSMQQKLCAAERPSDYKLMYNKLENR